MKRADLRVGTHYLMGVGRDWVTDESSVRRVRVLHTGYWAPSLYPSPGTFMTDPETGEDASIRGEEIAQASSWGHGAAYSYVPVAYLDEGTGNLATYEPYGLARLQDIRGEWEPTYAKVREALAEQGAEVSRIRQERRYTMRRISQAITRGISLGVVAAFHSRLSTGTDLVSLPLEEFERLLSLAESAPSTDRIFEEEKNS